MASQFPGDRPTLDKSTPPYRPGPPAGMVERIKNIIVAPQSEWPRIAAEPMTVQGIFTSWAAPLAAIGPVAGLIGSVLFFHTPIVVALVTAVVSFLMALVGVFILSQIINALAPSFGGTKDIVQATKLAVFSYTPAWVAGILNIIPPLGVIAALAGLYGLYLLWLGLPVLMRSPADKQVGYFVVILVVALVVGLIIGMIVGAVVGAVALAMVASTAGTTVYIR